MTTKGDYIVQPYLRRDGDLTPTDALRCASEDEAFRRGRQMMDRVAGVVFYRIETSASGDQWTEIELLATVGEAPEEAA